MPVLFFDAEDVDGDLVSYNGARLIDHLVNDHDHIIQTQTLGLIKQRSASKISSKFVIGL